MAKIRLTFVLAFIILLSSCTQCSHQTRNTETVRDSSDRNKDLDFHKSSRKGILLDVPIMSISREMTTETILECSGYQADAKNNNNFQVYVYGSWVTQKCHFGLIWNQEKCQCDWNPEIITELEETSQKMCDLTLNITFDDYVVSHQWHSLEISFVKGVVHIIDNDQLILNSTAYPAFVDLSQCPLSIGGNPTDAAKSFHGYIDSILLWRQCPANPERNDDLKIQ